RMLGPAYALAMALPDPVPGARSSSPAVPGEQSRSPAGPGGQSEGDRTPTRPLDVARPRLARGGYRPTPGAAIARGAGITPAAVYAYFAGKDALFVAAVDRDADALIASARAARTGTTVVDRLVASVDALADGLARHPLAQRVLAGLEPDVIGRLLDLP